MWDTQNHSKRMRREKENTVSKRRFCLPEGLPVRGKGSLTALSSAVVSDGAENGSTFEEAINITKCNIM